MIPDNYISGDVLKAARVLARGRYKTITNELEFSISTLKILEKHGTPDAPTRPSAARLIAYFHELGIEFTKIDGKICGVLCRTPIEIKNDAHRIIQNI